MSRAVVLSNGKLAIALDEYARVRDVYYPHVGQEDHVRGHYLHRVGVFADGRLSWLGEDDGWQITMRASPEALEGAVHAVHAELQVELSFVDAVYNERPVFLRRIAVKNMSSHERGIKLFFAHQFEIGKTHGGETAYFDPEQHAIIHYKGQRVFQIGAMIDGELFDDFTAGIYGFQGKEGSHRDAEDGILEKNPIEHGQVDSVIGLSQGFAPGQERVAHYWLAAAQSLREAAELAAYVLGRTPAHLVRSTRDYWRAWLASYPRHLHSLSEEQVALYRRSLLVVRAHVDTDGGILASLDSDMLRYALDTYGYVWPRDAAFAVLSLDMVGETNVSKHFFEFAARVLEAGGYFLHKYLPDGSLGSSWHPWFKGGVAQLPIQVDETALVVYALCEHYRHSRDLEFLEQSYASLIERPADFLVSYRSDDGLPRASYDLWEERRGTATFTAAAAYGALASAAEISRLLGKRAHHAHYDAAAREIRDGILAHLWDDSRGVFLKAIADDETRTPDRTIDCSSAYGVWRFGVLPADDPRLSRAFETTVRALSHGIIVGGIARYEGDQYYRSAPEAAGNPWIITTLWYAKYLIATARTDADMARVRSIFDWVVQHALSSGVLPEQLDARSGAPLSATPLMWSHAAYISAVIAYLEKIEQLGLCADCTDKS